MGTGDPLLDLIEELQDRLRERIRTKMIDLRTVDLRKVNSLTKYPSIPTHHVLDPKPDPHVNIRLAFRTPTYPARVLTDVLDAIKAHRQAGNPIPLLASSASAPPRDAEAVVSLTFQTDATPDDVLALVVAAINDSDLPYELTGSLCSSFDLDEVEE